MLPVHRKTANKQKTDSSSYCISARVAFSIFFQSGPSFFLKIIPCFKQWCQPVTGLSCVALLFVLRDSDSIKPCEQGDRAVSKTQSHRSWQVQAATVWELLSCIYSVSVITLLPFKLLSYFMTVWFIHYLLWTSLNWHGPGRNFIIYLCLNMKSLALEVHNRPGRPL